MRYSRMENRQPPEKSGNHKGALIFIILIALAAGIYVISASEAGKFLADNVLEPIKSAFSDDTLSSGKEEDELPANKDKEGDNEYDSISLEVEEFSIYALQAGVFADEENAQKYADELKNKGGAGFVTAFENGYRVFISGYLDEEDAKNVKNRLLSEQNMDTSVFQMVGGSITANITADDETLSIIRELDLNGDIIKLTEVSISRDKGEMSEEEATQELSKMYNSASVNLGKFKEIEDDKLAKALTEYYTSLCEVLSKAIAQSEEVAFSSRIKLAYLSAADARGKLAESLGE